MKNIASVDPEISVRDDYSLVPCPSEKYNYMTPSILVVILCKSHNLHSEPHCSPFLLRIYLFFHDESIAIQFAYSLNMKILQ